MGDEWISLLSLDPTQGRTHISSDHDTERHKYKGKIALL